MNEINITIPENIRFISEWKNYSLPQGHCIIDKGVTGCGFTEYCLTNGYPLVLCSPRRLLLENKRDQHLGDSNIIYLENNLENFQDVTSFKNKVNQHIASCEFTGKPIKFMITYDSLHYLSDYLRDLGIINNFYFIVDEFQSIFMDAYFKPEVEFDFVDYLQDCPNVVYLSATPMLDKYLDQLPEFKDLPFYKFDWSNTRFVEKIKVIRKRSWSLAYDCGKIVEDYLNGKFQITLGSNGKPIESKEVVFYFNSVQDIVRIVKKHKLTPQNAIIVCSDREENVKALKKIHFEIGKIPLPGEPNPMFMFCTRTVYVGVDFYSKCARSFVFSTPNIKCLATDIQMDLPQIAGRQRDTDNPFKSEIVLYYQTVLEKFTEEEFLAAQEERRKATAALLSLYEKAQEGVERNSYKNKLLKDIKNSQYSDDFLGFSKKSGLPVYNNMIDISNQRAWEVAQKDYQDNISVMSAIQSISGINGLIINILTDAFLHQFMSTSIFAEKLKIYCDFRESGPSKNEIIYFDNIINDPQFNNYYAYYGASGCKAKKYRKSELYGGWKNDVKEDVLEKHIRKIFKSGDRLTLKEIKIKLAKIYADLGISKAAKATDLEDYFKVAKTKITLPNKSIKHGYKLSDL